MEKVRWNIYLPQHMADELRVLADDLGFNMSTMITLACKNYIDQQKALKMANMGIQLGEIEKMIAKNLKSE